MSNKTNRISPVIALILTFAGCVLVTGVIGETAAVSAAGILTGPIPRFPSRRRHAPCWTTGPENCLPWWDPGRR